MQQITRFELPALCIANTLSACSIGAQSLWVAALVRSGSLSISAVGSLASGELFTSAIASLAVSAWGQRASPRRMAVVASALATIANLVAMVPSLPALVMGRLLAGVAVGTLVANIYGIAARRQDAQRVFSIMPAAAIAAAGGMYFISGTLIGRYGPAGLFALLACLSAASLAATLRGLSDLSAVSAAPGSTQIRLTRDAVKTAPLLASLALLATVIGLSPIGPYVVLIGSKSGVSVGTIGTILGVTTPLVIAGSLAARALGERVGLLSPLLFSIVALAIDLCFLVIAGSPIPFSLCLAVYFLSGGFFNPYAMALLSRTDPSGRFASAAPAIFLVGSAAGPKIGSTIISLWSFQMLAPFTATLLIIGVCLYSIAARVGKRFPELSSKGA